mmetsp:Transcript_24758/g.27662  ORF Transcript_24758/g.27662 Transcript_24758/m.27662 type:complete len:297 (+) Transcript_24758:260-1150(+)
MPGKGLISAPIQKARSDGWSAGGISPKSSRMPSIWFGECTLDRASLIHRSTKLRLLGMCSLGIVNSSAFLMALASDVRPYVSPSTSTLFFFRRAATLLLTSSSSSWAESRNCTFASVYPPPAVSMLPVSISKRLPVALSTICTPCPSGRNCNCSSIICTSTPRVIWTGCPLARRAIPSMPKKGDSLATRSRTSSIRRALLTWIFSTCRGSMASKTTSGNICSFSCISLRRLFREDRSNIDDDDPPSLSSALSAIRYCCVDEHCCLSGPNLVITNACDGLKSTKAHAAATVSAKIVA